MTSQAGVQMTKKTTRPPIINITDYFPQFKNLQKSAILLHPRRATEEMNLLDSKLGESILWPMKAEWPYCPAHAVPYRPILQLNKADFPNLEFWRGTDLFQILWCPHSHSECDWLPARKVYWRHSSDVTEPLYPNPEMKLNAPFLETDAGRYVPASCRFYPEQVIEYPDFDELQEELKHDVENWKLPPLSSVKAWLKREEKQIPLFTPGEWLYMDEISNSSGSKVGGYPGWIQYPDYPICERGHRMELFLSLSSVEPATHEGRWTTAEEADLSDDERYQIGFGTELMFGDGGIVYIFICRSCEEWPLGFVWQCG